MYYYINNISFSMCCGCIVCLSVEYNVNWDNITADSAKLADELAQQIQTALTDFETEYDRLCDDYGRIEIEWEENDINITGVFYNESYIDEFKYILEDITTDLPKAARRIDGNVRAIIELNDGKYTIYTYIGDESAVR